MGTKQVCVYIHTTGRKTWDNALKSLAMLTGLSEHHGSHTCGDSESCDFISSTNGQKIIADSHMRLCRSVSVDVCCYVTGHTCAASPGGEGRILTLMNNVGMSVYCLPPQPPLHPHSLSPFLPLSLEGTERAFYCSTSPPFFFQESTQRTSSAFNIHHRLTASNHVRLPYRVHVCVCVRIPVCVCDGGRQAVTGRENPFVFHVNPQGHVQALMNRRETRAEQAWGELELIFHVAVGFRDLGILRSKAVKAPPTCLWLTRCVWPDLSPFTSPAEGPTLPSTRAWRSFNFDEPRVICGIIRKG